MQINSRSLSLIALTVGGFILVANSAERSSQPLDPHLEPLRPFLEKTWRGEFKDSKPEKPTTDVSRWERALNGQAVRVLHSINDGSYGGESLIRWDNDQNQVVYHYFSTAGFYNVGTMTFTSNKVSATEKVIGNTNGITEVQSTYELRPNGTILNRAQYLKNGQPAGQREVLYREDPTAAVRFK